MMVKVFQSNANGKIEFTRAELEKLLNEVYKKGYDTGVSDTKQNYWTWTSPSISNLCSPSVTYTTNTSTSIDNLRCNNASKVATLEPNTAKCTVDVLEAKKDNFYTTDVCADKGCVDACVTTKSITPSSITVQLNDVGEIPTNVNLAKSIDEIVNALFNSKPETVKTGTISSERSDASTPHDRLARELRYL
jgi:hypothetical protein